MPAGIHFQTRDIDVLAELGEVGQLDTTTINKRHFPDDRTGRACQRRLHLFGELDLVRHCSLQITYADKRPGRLPTIFSLTPRGAEVLTTLTGQKPRRFSSKDPKPETLLHRLGLAKFQLIVRDACAHERIPMTWIGEYDSKPGVALSAPRSERFYICESFPTADGGAISCWPDASFWLQIPSQAAGQELADLIVYVEYDRSTESLHQIACKMPGFQALLTRGAVGKHWPQVPKPTVRIFFIVPSEERLQNIAEAIKDCPAATAVRLATEAKITADRFFTAPIWHTVQGESRSIIRSSESAA